MTSSLYGKLQDILDIVQSTLSVSPLNKSKSSLKKNIIASKYFKFRCYANVSECFFHAYRSVPWRRYCLFSLRNMSLLRVKQEKEQERHSAIFIPAMQGCFRSQQAISYCSPVIVLVVEEASTLYFTIKEMKSQHFYPNFVSKQGNFIISKLTVKICYIGNWCQIQL